MNDQDKQIRSVRFSLFCGLCSQVLAGIGAVFVHGHVFGVVLPVLFGLAFFLSPKSPATVMLCIAGAVVVTELIFPELDNTIASGMGVVRACYLSVVAFGVFGALKFKRTRP